MRAWDDGVRWHLEQVEAPTADELDLSFVRDQHLRVSNGSIEDLYIDGLMRTSRRMAERTTRRAHYTQSWMLVMDRFPCGEIVLPMPPLQSITSIVYIDEDGAEQALAGSPLEYQVSAPSGAKAKKGRVAPLVDAVWPTTKAGLLEAVWVTFVCGYPTVEDVPEDITHGRLLMIAEMYKQRSESAIGNGVTVTPAVLRAMDLWKGYRAY